ncbi:MAG: nucleotidyltransferase family protein [Cyclobacteriaceae bacterium]
MMTQVEILDKLREHKADIQKKYPVASLALFGSFARGDQSPENDVDLLVEFNGPIGWEIVDLVEELEKLLNVKKVDLVTKKYVKPHYLPFIEESIIHV